MCQLLTGIYYISETRVSIIDIGLCGGHGIYSNYFACSIATPFLALHWTLQGSFVSCYPSKCVYTLSLQAMVSLPMSLQETVKNRWDKNSCL